MKRIQLAIVTILALAAITAITMATAASAETTKVLPEGTTASPLSFSGASRGGKLVSLGGSTLTCTSSTGKGAFTSANLGTGKVEFGGCTGPLGSTCTGEGDRAGIILTEGTLHYLLALEMTGTGTATTLVGAGVVLQKEFHFTCEALGVKQLILIRGCSAGRDESAEKLTEKVVGVSRQWATGESRILEILPPGATSESKCLLESNINGQGFTLSALEGSGIAEKWEQGGARVTVLLMNK